jgi:hypothetical protein
VIQTVGHNRNMKKVDFYFTALFILSLVGCSGSLSGSSGINQAVPLTQKDEIDIYQAVIRQLCGPDDTFRGTLKKPFIYIHRSTSDAAADPSLEDSVSVILSDAVQAGITKALSDLPSQIVWVNNYDDVPREEKSSAVLGGGVIIRLGNIKFVNRNRVLVPGSIYMALSEFPKCDSL